MSVIWLAEISVDTTVDAARLEARATNGQEDRSLGIEDQENQLLGETP
jgi:hypothetical protein